MSTIWKWNYKVHIETLHQSFHLERTFCIYYILRFCVSTGLCYILFLCPPVMKRMIANMRFFTSNMKESHRYYCYHRNHPESTKINHKPYNNFFFLVMESCNIMALT